MKQRLGIYFVLAVLMLTSPLHIFAASVVLGECIGEFFAPGQDHIFFFFAVAAVAGVFMISLMCGVACRYRWAMYLSASILLGGFYPLISLFPRPSIDWTFHLYDWLLCIGLSSLLFLSAWYLIWVASRRPPVLKVRALNVNPSLRK